jgi:DNA-binding MarR family transcriptional regulator
MEIPSQTSGVRFIDDYLVYLLARAAHQVSSEFHEHLRRRGISVAVWRVLSGLIGSEGETVTGLAGMCLLQQPTMTKLLDRSPDRRDRRVVRVALTAQGQAMAEDLAVAAKLHEADLLARHPPAEAEAIKNLLRSILARHHTPRRR